MSHGPAGTAGAVGQDDGAEEDLTLTMPRVTGDEPRPGPVAAPDVPEGDWADDDLTDVADGRSSQFASGMAAGLAAVPYVRAAIRRQARLWCATALVGLIIGLGLITVKPPAAKAQTQIELAYPSGVNVQDAVLTDVALLQTRSLAELALHRLGLTESVTKFMASFTVAEVTDQVLEIIASAPTSAEAVQRANVIAKTFLQYRGSLLVQQRQATMAKLNSDLEQGRLQLAKTDLKLAGVQHQPASTDRAMSLKVLQNQKNTDANALSLLEQGVSSYEVSSWQSYDQEVSGSSELYPASPMPPSKYKKPDVYAVGGLVGGLLLGMAYAAGSALMTDRLRRRDDVALAVGAPVRLSIGPLRLGRAGRRGRLSQARALHAAGGIDVQRVAAQLRSAVRDRANGAAALAVIAMDDPYAAVLPVLALALSCARAGGQVIIADLSADATAGRLLGFSDIGVRMINVDGEQIALCVPDPGDLLPIGPLPPAGSSPAGELAGSGVAGRIGGRARGSRIVVNQLSAVQSTAGFQLAAAYESADLLLTILTLDPALGAEHLPTWATDAVVVVTAGQSASTKIHSVCEMTRLAGTDISCAILVGADRDDDSIGTVVAPAGSDLGTASADLGTGPAEADEAPVRV
jgi:hypothetical protein